MSYISIAVERIRAQLGDNRVADILADVIHYCDELDIDFDAELRAARLYVFDEHNHDSEC